MVVLHNAFLVLWIRFYNQSCKNKSYIKDTTHFINFIENTPLPHEAFLATSDVCSLYTNIPRKERIEIVCHHYEEHYQSNLPIPAPFLVDLMRLILTENSFNSTTNTTNTDTRHCNGHQNGGCFLSHFHCSNHSSGIDLLITYSQNGLFLKPKSII